MTDTEFAAFERFNPDWSPLLEAALAARGIALAEPPRLAWTDVRRRQVGVHLATLPQDQARLPEGVHAWPPLMGRLVTGREDWVLALNMALRQRGVALVEPPRLDWLDAERGRIGVRLRMHARGDRPATDDVLDVQQLVERYGFEPGEDGLPDAVEPGSLRGRLAAFAQRLTGRGT